MTVWQSRYLTAFGTTEYKCGIPINKKEQDSKKNKRRRKTRNYVEPPKAITSTPGTGIVLNINDKEKNDALITNWEHGDLILELEVLLTKGSNSGIYFQGRYELQIKDSWGVKNPLGSDMGGFHNNWEKYIKKLAFRPQSSSFKN